MSFPFVSTPVFVRRRNSRSRPIGNTKTIGMIGCEFVDQLTDLRA